MSKSQSIQKEENNDKTKLFLGNLSVDVTKLQILKNLPKKKIGNRKRHGANI